jgi:hypothetical protein
MHGSRSSCICAHISNLTLRSFVMCVSRTLHIVWGAMAVWIHCILDPATTTFPRAPAGMRIRLRASIRGDPPYQPTLPRTSDDPLQQTLGNAQKSLRDF